MIDATKLLRQPSLKWTGAPSAPVSGAGVVASIIA